MTPVLTKFDPPARVLKRAQYEAFAFELLDGDIRVRNESYADPAAHEYRVRIRDGVPDSCSCPADASSDSPCKHRIAVVIRPRVLDLAVQMRVVADGGSTSSGDDETTDLPCECEQLSEALPCWNCVDAGRRNLSE
ncbi:SWIM zinc finger family protein [Haloferax sulfurifontis]|uniref:SWIM zinc finger domain protein n=1 Tax=Haloferax sulfurifontis ATCC BAA-897 TaxID=662480 RepID=M0IIT8_9EURY|nr:SWIM zinc finger family protein [Haloferax sulfurifontis]ELZ96670.1 SWIM zinc finger domain protein [Haloferax sulfurifontis ATCC BAA-897]